MAEGLWGDGHGGGDGAEGRGCSGWHGHRDIGKGGDSTSPRLRASSNAPVPQGWRSSRSFPPPPSSPGETHRIEG